MVKFVGCPLALHYCGFEVFQGLPLPDKTVNQQYNLAVDGPLNHANIPPNKYIY